ncbi:MAG: alpha/beta hydrolase [Saprospiraceae bacterium]|nr:alpha/beta hydrolase [Saprospiraceae bacterium]
MHYSIAGLFLIILNTEQSLWRNNLLQALSNFINEQKINNATAVGHSWGTMIAIQLAARRPDVIHRVITVDGSIESDSWAPKTKQERLTQANNIITNWEEKLKDAEQWRQFNMVGLPQQDSIDRRYAEGALLLHGSFMATSRNALLQYWRENVLIDLTSDLKKVKVPILDIQCFTGQAQDQQKETYLKTLQDIGNPGNVKMIFFYDTRHFVMFHRPLKLENRINDFIKGKPVQDFIPSEGR